MSTAHERNTNPIGRSMSDTVDWNETVMLRSPLQADEQLPLAEAVRCVIDDGRHTAFIAFMDLQARADLQLAAIKQLGERPDYPFRKA
jgi:hypothetical protein